MTRISNTVVQFVRLRAGDRCEYCLSHQSTTMGILQVDHIWPIAQGGSNDESNLCLACELCNGYKWQKTGGIDPVTGASSALFNPREQHWKAHFAWNETGDELIGLTPCGRVTIIALNMNNPIACTVRRNWIRAGWHPPEVKD